MLQNKYKRRFRRVQTTAVNYTELAKWEKDFSLIGWENLTLFEEYLEMGLFFKLEFKKAFKTNKFISMNKSHSIWIYNNVFYIVSSWASVLLHKQSNRDTHRRL